MARSLWPGCLVVLLVSLLAQRPVLSQASASSAERQVRLVTQTTGGPMRQVDVTTDGRLALTLEASFLRVWDFESGREWRRLRPRLDVDEQRRETFWAFWVLPNSSRVAVDTGDHLVVHDIESGRELRRCELTDRARSSESAFTFVRMAPSPRTQEMAIGSASGFELLDLSTCRRSRRQTSGSVSALAWAPDGSAIAAAVRGAATGPAIEIWGPNDRKPRQRIALSTAAGAVAVSSGGRIAAGCDDGSVVVITARGAAASIDGTVQADTGPVGAVEWVDSDQVLIRHASEPPASGYPRVGRLLIWRLNPSSVRAVSTDVFRAARLIRGANAVLVGDAQVLTRQAFGPARVIDLASGTTTLTLQGTARSVMSAAFLDDGSGIATGLEDGSVRVWPTTGSPFLAASPLPPEARVGGLFVSPAEYVVSDDGIRLHLWSRASASKPRTFGRPMAVTSVIQWSRDGRRVLVRHGYPSSPFRYEVWDASENRLLCAFDRQDADQFNFGAVLSPDGRVFVTFGAREGRTLPGVGYVTGTYLGIKRDAETCKETSAFFTDTHLWITAAGFSRDGRVLYIGSRGGVSVWNFDEDPVLPRRFDDVADARGLAITADPRTMAILTGDGRVTFRAFRDRKLIGIVDTGMALAHTLDISPDGRHLLVASAEGPVAIVDVQRLAVVANLVSLDDGTWTVTDPQGRYDATDPNRSSGLHWIIGRDVLGIDQLPAQRFYVPHLLSAALGNRPLPAENSRLSQLETAPAVSVDDVQPGATELRVTLTNRGGGLGPVAVWVNKRRLAGEFRPRSVSASTETLTIPLTGAVYRSSGPNEIEVVAYSASDRIASQPRGLEIPASEPPPATLTTRLHGLFVGTSSFRNSSLNLQFAAKDAADMAGAVRLGASRLLGDARVRVQVLTSDAAPDRRPTKTNILRAFAEVAKTAAPEDVVVVYFAGHGVAHGTDQYFYLTEDANSIELADEKSRVENTISSDELQRWLQLEVKALKQVVILDTCAAGAASAGLRQLAAKRTLSPEQIRALAFLQKATGSFILMGSAADRVSYEAGEYGQGLLTYALLGGLSGEIRELQNGQELWVNAWLNHAEKRVPALAEGIGGIQVPNHIRPAGNDFPIMALTADVKQAIPIAQPKPRILQPLVVDRQTLGDVVPLLSAVRTQLRRLSEPATRGEAIATGRVVYLDGVSGDVPRAIMPRIRCEKTDAGWRATIDLWRDTELVWSSAELTLPADAPQAAASLADEIVRASLSLARSERH